MNEKPVLKPKPMRPRTVVGDIKGTILVADDSPTQQRLIRAPFETDGYGIVTASDGVEAVARVEEREDLALVVLDVVMPNMNGFQACKKIRQMRPDLPIILLTTKDQKSDEFWGLRQGADLYMTKPFDPQELLANALSLMKRA